VPHDAGARQMHAEMGHLPLRRSPRDGGFPGSCPFHGDCVEGLASGAAIRARWGCDLAALPADHPGRELIAGYLGQLAAAIALAHAPQRIVFGGGVMSDATLLPRIRQAAHDYLNGYLPPLRNAASFDEYLCPPALDSRSGVIGAMLLAQQLLAHRRTPAAFRKS
jgi:fructokinase